MVRYAICVVCLLVLVGCERYGLANAPAQLAAQVSGGQDFTYSHNIQLTMPHGTIMPRFERARDRCLQDATLSCTLVSSSLNVEDDVRYRSSFAQLVVLLPHNLVTNFRDSLLQPLGGESVSSAGIRSQSTEAGNVTKEETDIARRVAQLTEYRDRLTALLRRADVKVDELIKIASELASAQGNVEQLTAQKRDVDERVAKDRLTISFNERPTWGDAFLPMSMAWRSGVETFSESAAEALNFLIRTVPWLPILALAFFVLSRLWNFTRRRRAAAAAPVPVP